MKKIIFTLLILTGFVTAGMAQITIKPAFGLNASRLSTDPGNWKHDGRLGFQFGGSVAIGKKFYVEPGIFWMKNNADITHTGDGGSGPTKFNHNISMIRVPVFAGFNILGNEESLADLRVFLGPAMNIVTGINNSEDHPDSPKKEDYKSVIWGGDIGLGVSVWWLFLDAGYEFGFSKVYKDNDKFGSAKASGLWTNLGVRIRL